LTSVLFPRADTAQEVEAPPDCFRDLRLDDIVAAVCEGHPDDRVTRLFYQPLGEVSAVEHRHQVFGDLERENVRRSITDFTQAMAAMRAQIREAEWVRHRWQRHGWFLHAAHTFCNAVTALSDRLARCELSSRGLRDFTDHLGAFVGSDTFRTLARDTEAVLTALGDIRYTVHIHGRHVRVEKYCGQADFSHQAVSLFDRFASEVGKDYGVRIKDDAEMNPVEQRVLECVAKLHPETFARLEDFHRRRDRFVEPTISRFDREIRFYLLYLAFVERFAGAGVSFSYPELTDMPGTLSADNAYDLALAIKTKEDQNSLVGNGFHLSDAERVLVVTGPNQGGKTTFARTIGQCAYLASLGCPIPAKRGAFTLPDAIYTHFDRQETLSTEHGKLHDELLRIHEILSRATATSLIVMNESFSSTTVGDALLIGTDVVKRIIKRDSTAVYVSFLGELARVDPACVSLVAEMASDDPTRRTFTFTRRPADGLAYAAALANKYGLNYEILRRRITS
jgi:DNA mismatch repair protein MutS